MITIGNGFYSHMIGLLFVFDLQPAGYHFPACETSPHTLSSGPNLRCGAVSFNPLNAIPRLSETTTKITPHLV